MARTRKKTDNTKLLKTHKEVITALESEGDFLIDYNTEQVTLQLPWRRKGFMDMTKVHLVRQPDGQYFLEPAKKQYTAKVSHFDYCMPEERFSRSKQHIVAFIKRLKQSQVWELIANRSGFIVLNDNNTSMDKNVIGKELKDLILR